MAIREGAWDCPHCGRTRNRGPRKFCPGCGAPRGEGVPFYLPDDARVVTDADEIARAQAGPDWVCVHCEGDNPADVPFCSGCGASRDGSTRREVVEQRFAAPAPPPPAQPAPRNSGCRRRLGCYGGGCLALFLFFFVVLVLNTPPSYNTGDRNVEYVDVESPRPLADVPRETVLTVAEVEWKRSIDVDALRTFTESDWEDEVPDGARVLSSSREVHHTEQVRTRTETRVRTWTERVQTGTERVRDGSDRVQIGSERVQVGVRDLGNGYFEDVYENRPVYEERPRYENRPVYKEVERRETYLEPVYEDRPVYRQRVRYEIGRWRTVRTVDASGKDHSPAWPEVQLESGDQEGARRESYTVLLRAPDGTIFTHKLASEAEWRGFEVGSTYKATLSPRGELAQVGDLVEAAPHPPAPSPIPSPRPGEGEEKKSQ